MRRTVRNLTPGDITVDPNGRAITVSRVEPSSLTVNGSPRETVIIRGEDSDGTSYARAEQVEAKWSILQK